MLSPDTLAANALRVLAADAVEAAKSGHPGMPMGMADVASILFREFINISPDHPDWINRDRFVLSAGHGSMLLYGVLHLLGFKDATIEDMKSFRKLHGRGAGHPEFGHMKGIETTTGPLGQGLANAVGMALAERHLAARFPCINHHTYVIAGDGCLMEGIGQEAISFAGHQQLSKLIVLFDDNGITIDGGTDLSISDNMQMRFEASNWHYIAIDGHNTDEIRQALKKAHTSDRPTLIACKTTIGQGAPGKKGSNKVHGSPLGADEIQAMRQTLNWEHAPFEIPQHIYDIWGEGASRSLKAYDGWLKKYPDHQQAADYMDCPVPDELEAKLFQSLKPLELKPMATRQSSEETLKHLTAIVPYLIGGSADLTGSNNTRVATHTTMTPAHPEGKYINYGIREHLMGAVMNGLALHGGCIPYGGTFLVFSDYMRPPMRLAALMGIRVIYVMTHDSIGLGEDGPTHQPIEHLMSLRLIPNLNVFRPADLVETAECWALAVSNPHQPAVLSLTRQIVPPVRTFCSENKSAKGAYILMGDPESRGITLIATGSEVHIAIDVAKKLEHLHPVVVSMPSMDLFDRQDRAYKAHVLGESTSPRVSIEAGCTRGFETYAPDLQIGIDTFGASAPASDLFDHFGLTADKICARIQSYLESRE